MNRKRNTRDHRLAFGFIAGAAAGVGLMMWLAPRSASELAERIGQQAKDFGQGASERYDAVSGRVAEAVAGVTRKGRAVRDDVADVVARSAHEVARGAHDVERHANAVKS
jgi:gas vesicle protein